MIDHPTHREARSVFVECFNVVYPDWEVNYSNRDLKCSDVDYAAMKTYRGRCGPRSGGRVYFGVRRSFWEDVGRPRQVALVLHELGHVKQLDHSPAFWELVAKLFWRLYDEREVLGNVFDDGVMQSEGEWEKVKEHLVFNPTTSMVDNRSECVSERRASMKELLEWDGEVGRWDGVKLRTLLPYGEKSVWVYLDDIEVPESERVSEEELFEWFSNPWGRDGVKVDDSGYSYRVEPWSVKRLDDKVPVWAYNESEPIDGDFVATDGFMRVQLYQAVYDEDAKVRVLVE